MHRISFGAFKKTVADAVSSAAHGARDLAFDAKDALERALVAKCLRPYIVKDQLSSSGPKGLWKIYTADCRNPGYHSTDGRHHSEINDAARWTLPMCECLDSGEEASAGISQATESSMGCIYRSTKNESILLTKSPDINHRIFGLKLKVQLKHPGILKVIEPLEETRTQFVMVTEPILCSLSDWLSHFSAVPHAPESTKDVAFSELEIKHGLLQLASAIRFLHNDANLVHCSINPESVLVCADGHWALANFGLSVQVNDMTSKSITSFDFTDRHPPLDELASKPHLQFIAPELATAQGDDMSISVTSAADVFAFALMVYASLTRVGLLSGIEGDIRRYKTVVAALSPSDLSVLPPPLQLLIRQMLSITPSERPPISSVGQCPYFQDDVLLRALQFLEGMMGKDTMQKASFLKDLDTFWPKFDIRVVRHKVLPPLLLELQNPSLQSLIIPFVFRAAGNQTKQEFESYTLPQLKPLLNIIKGEALLMVVSNCDALNKVMTDTMVSDVLLPIFLKAFDQQIPKIQEEALKKMSSIVDRLDYQHLKTHVLKRLHSMSLRTVSAKVRINSLVLMGGLVPRLDKEEAQRMLQSCAQITNVDKTPGTLMCVLGVGDAISRYWGEEMTAQLVIPYLSPLLVAKTFSHQQFGTYVTVMRDMINRIEEKRGKQIQVSQPLTVNHASRQDSQESSTWDTAKPKETWNGVEQDTWMDMAVTVESTQSVIHPQSTVWSEGQQPMSNPLPMMHSVDSHQPKQLPSTVVQPAASSSSVFDFDDFVPSMPRPSPAVQQQMHTIQPPAMQQPPAQMLDPMMFGSGLASNVTSASMNGNIPQEDFFSGLQFHQSSQPSLQSSQPQTISSDPFANLTATQPVPKSNDPFADLLR